MAGEWSEQLLRDLLVTTKDGDWGKENPEEGVVPYHIIRGTDFPDVRLGDLSSVPLRYLPEHTVQRRTLEPDDILIETAGGTRDRPTGRTLLVTEKVLARFNGPVTCASFARFLRIDRKQADPRFVFWYLQHLYDKGEMSQHQVQHTGVARFQYTRFAETQNVPLPPLAEQKAIAAVLGALDDKIELNRRMNATLEAMARALFQSWFVDFDPVRAKLDGRKPEGLDKSTAALFPSSFQDSSRGPIPRGWEVRSLDSIASVGSGKRPSGRCDVSSADCNIPLLGGGGKMGYVPSPLYEKPILFTGRVGTLGQIFRTTGPSWPSDNTLIVEVQERFFDFTYFVLKGFDLVTLNRGSTQPLLTQTDLKRQQFVLPPDEVVKGFAEISSSLFQRIAADDAQSRTLATLRDTLLPKLLSGELAVPPALGKVNS